MKKMLNKKGFTLVELLAVIVVLAIIMLVVADRVGDAMKQSRGDSLMLQVKSMQREIDKVCIVNNEITVSEVTKIVEDAGLAVNEDITVTTDSSESRDFTAKAKRGSKFANIIVPKTADKNIITNIPEKTNDLSEPIVKIQTSCPIVADPAS